MCKFTRMNELLTAIFLMFSGASTHIKTLDLMDFRPFSLDGRVISVVKHIINIALLPLTAISSFTTAVSDIMNTHSSA